MVHADLDALQESNGSVVQKIAYLEETLHLAQEEEFQLKEDVGAKSYELIAIDREIEVKSKALIDLEVVPTM